VLAEALRAFGDRGYASTSLDDVAEAAGIRKQSLLYHFPNKEQLFAASALHAAEEVFETLDGSLRDDDPGGLDRLTNIVSAVHRLASERPEVVGLIREVARTGPPLSDVVAEALRPLVDAAVAWLSAEMDAGAVRRQDPRTALLTIYSAVVGHLTESSVRRVLLDGADPPQEELVAFLRAALAP
jgi:TetR/AcrR family transcriptional regulator